MTEEKIQDYVNGSLAEAEAAEVAAALAADPALARLAEQYRTIFKGLRQQRVSEIEKDLLQFDQAGPNDPGNKNNPSRFWLWSGGLLLLLLLVFGAIQQKRNFSDAALAGRFFQLPTDPRLAGPEADENRVYFQAIDDFYNKDYKAAILGFSGLQSSNDYGVIASFYLPHAQFMDSDYQTASQYFESALLLKDLIESDRERLAWNAMITKLALGENINDQLDREWGRGYPVDELKATLNSFWR